MMERNEALLRKVGDVIAAEPERYDQCTWIDEEMDCGTVACVAGHTAMLHPEYEGVTEYGRPGVLVAGRERHTEGLAEEMLGIHVSESFHLFSGNWVPAGPDDVPLHERVRDALYRLADGASIEDVTA